VSTTEEGAQAAAGAGGAAYPRHWEADVLLRDGRVAHLRPIRPDDHDLLVAFYEEVSAESKYLRFFAPMPHLSERDVTRFTTVDNRDRVAFVHLDEEADVVLRDEVVLVHEPEIELSGLDVADVVSPAAGGFDVHAVDRRVRVAGGLGARERSGAGRGVGRIVGEGGQAGGRRVGVGRAERGDANGVLLAGRA